jgi:hypothetical protein
MPVAVGTGGKTVTTKGILSASQPITNKTWTPVVFDTTVDVDSTDTSLINTTTGRFEPKEDGYYYLSANLHFYVDTSADKTVGGSVDFKVYRDGSVLKTHNGSNGERTIASNSARVNGYAMTYLQVGDSVQVRAYGQTSAGSLSLSPSASNFSVFLISGGSASGDSIVTQEGNEVTVGDISVTKTTLHGKIHLTPEIPTPSLPVNTHISEEGVIFKTTTTYYSTEEVDKKLAIKDKLIEKLSARLDELEKKVK